MKEIVVIHHGGCSDGTAAAWAVWQKLRDIPGVTLTPVAATHGEPLLARTDGLDVIMVDFCYPPEVMAMLRSTCRSVLVIDHHITAFKTLEDWSYAGDNAKAWLAYYQGRMPASRLPNGGLAIYTDVGRSGAKLAWDFFNPGVPAPDLIDYVQDRDLWRFELDHSRVVAEWIAALPADLRAWEVAIEAFRHDPRGAIVRGDAILEYKQKAVRELVLSASTMTIGGHQVPVCNAPHQWGSDVAEVLLSAPSNYWPFAAYYYDGRDGRNFGLRSTAPDGTDVAAIAKHYGGGGHKHAAGFRAVHGWRGDSSAGPKHEVMHG